MSRQLSADTADTTVASGKQEVIASLAAAKNISMDAKVADFLSDLFFLFFP